MNGFTCMIALALFFSSVVMCVIPPTTLNRFKAVVTDKQWATYQQISAERLDIYVRSLLLGLIVGYVFTAIMKKSDVCQVTALILMMTSLIYTLSPKSKYMIEDLNTAEQRQEWLTIYKEQKLKGHVSAAIGFLVIPIFKMIQK